MTSGKIKAVLFIIVFLLIVAVVASWFVSRDEPSAPAAEPEAAAPSVTADTEVVVTPEPTAVLITPAPKPSQAPQPTPAPTPIPTPSPTPEPLFPLPTETETPVPFVAGETLGSGRIQTQNGLGIDLIADWSAVAVSADEIRLDVDVSLFSGALYTGEGGRAVLISAGGQYATLEAPLISFDGPGMATHALGSHSFTLSAPAGQSTALSLVVNWQYNGKYGDVSIPSLECGGTINLSR